MNRLHALCLTSAVLHLMTGNPNPELGFWGIAAFVVLLVLFKLWNR